MFDICITEALGTISSKLTRSRYKEQECNRNYTTKGYLFLDEKINHSRKSFCFTRNYVSRQVYREYREFYLAISDV